MQLQSDGVFDADATAFSPEFPAESASTAIAALALPLESESAAHPETTSEAQPAGEPVEAQPAGSSVFTELGLAAPIVAALREAGYDQPTPVQLRAIPAALAGKDLMVSSPTGSGKTAAFMLPAIQLLGITGPARAAAAGENRRPERRGGTVARPGLLVLTPTRELAMQVSQAAQVYGRNVRKLRVASVLGGMPYRQQLALFAKQPEIIVATPGRLIDHLQRGKIDLSALSMLVLDEADRMLDMGFIEDIETIVAATPASRQTLLFSATLDGRISSLTQRLLRDPERIEIVRRPEQKANITQSMHWVDDRSHKDRLLTHLLADRGLDQAIVFTATKSDADMLAARLAGVGFSSAALHGDLPQGARNRTIRDLREKRVRVLVATDVAARGIDIPGITHVFNYDLPKFAEDYVHRIGRTGRAGRNGIAVSLVQHAELQVVKRIERFTHQPLPVNIVAGFEPRLAPPTKSAAGTRGRGRPGGGGGNGARPSSPRGYAGGARSNGNSAGKGTGSGFGSGGRGAPRQNRSGW